MPLLPLLLFPVLVAPTSQQQPEPFWHYAMMGSRIGQTDFAVVDVNGQPELFTGASSRTAGPDDYWYALRRDAATGTWVHTFVSPNRQTGVIKIKLGDLLPGSGAALAVLIADGTVELWDPVGKALLNTLVTAAVQPRSMDLADLNGDGLDELFIISGNRLWIYDSAGGLIRSIAAGGSDVEVAQMDADQQLEIALASGVVVDGLTFVTQFSFNAGLVTDLEAGDIDGDGRAELLAISDQDLIFAYDVDLSATRWTLPQASPYSIRLVDVENDGLLELLVGRGQVDGVFCYDALTASAKWSLSGSDSGVPDAIAVDVDGNGDKEILWSGGASTTGEDHFLVTDWQTNSHQWRSEHLDGPFIGPVLGDLDGDQIPELVVASSESSSHYADGRILVFDSQTLLLKGISPPVASGHSALGIHDLVLYDLQGDGRDEILIAADDYYDGLIEAFSFTGGVFSLVWTNPMPLPQGAPFFQLKVADVDRNGDLEIVGGTGRVVSGSGIDEQLFYVYDVNTQTEEWRSAETGIDGDLVAEIDVVDFNRDGTPEIYGMVGGGAIYVYDGRTKALRIKVPGQFRSLLGLTTGPNTFLVLGDAGGWVNVYSSAGGGATRVYQRQFAASAIDSLTPGPPGKAWIASSDQILLVNLGSGVVEWQSENYGTNFGHHVALVAGAATTFFSAGRYGVIGFH